ncbi:MAG: hypothetical protein ACK55X_00260 [Synechococcaceae cyanobacterium]|jgi:hypothetical protein
MLNWRRDPGYEQRMNALAIRIQQTKNDTEQIEREILRVRSDSERIKKEAEQIRSETEQLRAVNAKLRALNACGRRLCSPPGSSSTPATATEADSTPSLP